MLFSVSIVGSMFGEKDSSFKVNTPSAVAGVRGTIFILDVGVDPVTGVSTTKGVGVEGHFTFDDLHGGSYLIGPNQFSSTSESGHASPPLEIDRADFNSLMMKVTAQPRQNRVTPLNLQREGREHNPPPPSNPEFKPLEVKPSSMTGSTGGSDGALGQALTGINPSDLIYQEPPAFTELQFIVTFNFN